jgi:D-alanine-D-alanine ligase
MIRVKSKIRRVKKIRVGVLFGGRSAEHEVSLVSAESIMNALGRNRYTIIPIGITPDGCWFSDAKIFNELKQRRYRSRRHQSILSPDPTTGGLLSWTAASQALRRIKLDVVFPVLHGTFGEDGTLQGLLELANIPYVGAGVLGSSVSMDKVMTKQLCCLRGIPVSPSVFFYSHDFHEDPAAVRVMVEKNLDYPYFVKPANLGSSVGISKVHDRGELKKAILLASRYDRKILVEESIENAREIEVGVLGNDTPRASVPGEIIPSNEFYDYDAKYVDGASKAVIPAQLPRTLVRKLQNMAVDAFQTVECAGMARIDFLVVRKTGKIYFNEINTIPGFTSISMYPKLWKATGVSYPRLLDELIRLAIERNRENGRLQRVYAPKRAWYR